MWDAAIVILSITLYCTILIPTRILKGLSFLGKHSFNIFLFHSFILSYYLHDFIYWSRNPFMIIVTLLLVCLLVSVALESLKEILLISKLQKNLME